MTPLSTEGPWKEWTSLGDLFQAEEAEDVELYLRIRRYESLMQPEY